jgi:predicted acyl esterase
MVVWLPGGLAASENQEQQERVSRPGQYEGYSKATFDGWQRTSQYVTVRDGTRIAIDILRPTKGGTLHQEPLPVVWEHRRSSYVTEGCLRASHRATSEAPYMSLGLPYRRHHEQDVKDLPAEPVELVFDLLPTAKHFPAGHRIRVAVTYADKDSYQTPQRLLAPTIKVFRDTQRPSHVVLPIAN